MHDNPTLYHNLNKIVNIRYQYFYVRTDKLLSYWYHGVMVLIDHLLSTCLGNLKQFLLMSHTCIYPHSWQSVLKG